MDYVSVRAAAEKWGISIRRVQRLWSKGECQVRSASAGVG